MRNISFWKRRELLSRSVLKEILQEGKRQRIIEVRLTARVGAVAMNKDRGEEAVWKHNQRAQVQKKNLKC